MLKRQHNVFTNAQWTHYATSLHRPHFSQMVTR